MTADSRAWTQQAKSLFVSAGDISGDRHAGRVLAKLREVDPDLKIWGVGGPEMQAQNAELLRNCQSFAVIGLVEVLRFLPDLLRLRGELVREIGRRRPDAVLMVDFPGFNLRLSKLLKKHYPELPIIHLISPQLWGSRPWRMNTVKRYINKMLTIFPFEEGLYKKAGVAARFIGHPLAQTLPNPCDLPSRQSFCEAYGLDPRRPILGVFPGSRRQEIKGIGPVILQAAEWVLKERPEVQIVISRAHSKVASALDELIDHSRYRALLGSGLTLMRPGENYNLMAVSDLLWTKSGTTTLEASMYGKPMLIFYRGNWLSYLVFLLAKTVKHVGWPNLLAGRTLVPELLQLDCRAELLVRYTLDWLDVPALRQEISNALLGLRDQLGQGDFVVGATEEILKILGRPAMIPPADSMRSEPNLPDCQTRIREGHGDL